MEIHCVIGTFIFVYSRITMVGEGHFGAADSALDNSAPCLFGAGHFGAGHFGAVY